MIAVLIFLEISLISLSFVLIGICVGISIERKDWIKAAESGQNHFVDMEYYRVVKGSKADCSQHLLSREQLNNIIDKIVGLKKKGE